METERFDRITSRFAETGSRRRALGVLAAAFGVSGLGLLGAPEAEARRKKKCAQAGTTPSKKRKKCCAGLAQDGSGVCASPQSASPPPPGLALRAICTPGVSTCAAGLQCDTPTTRHTCSGTVDGIGTWCCVPPGGSCTECDCCGDNYCEFDDNNQPHCVHNPEDD